MDKIDLNRFLKSSKETTLDGVYFIYGPPGSGKTFLAGTASKFWPEDIPTKEEVNLNDMLWLSADAGATAGFEECGINVPNVIDFGVILAELGAQKGLKAVMSLAQEVLDKTSEIDTIVVDTVSAVDKYIGEYYDTNCPLDRQGNKDKFSMYALIKNFHQRFHTRIRGTGKKIIYLGHSKALIDNNDTNQANVKKASLPVGQNDIIPAITGSGREVYINESSILMVILATRKGNNYIRKVYPLGSKGFQGKNRFQQSLTEEEEPHLGKIFQKIKQGKR